MPRVQDTDEVRILRYFEEEPLEKVELLFPIIAEKMRQRMPPGRSSPKKKDMRPCGTQRRARRPVLPRVRPQKRSTRSCTHGCIDRHAFVSLQNGAVYFNKSR